MSKTRIESINRTRHDPSPFFPLSPRPRSLKKSLAEKKESSLKNEPFIERSDHVVIITFTVSSMIRQGR